MDYYITFMIKCLLLLPLHADIIAVSFIDAGNIPLRIHDQETVIRPDPPPGSARIYSKNYASFDRCQVSMYRSGSMLPFINT